MSDFMTMAEYDANETREDYLKRMRAEGFVTVEPKADELQIDIDTEEQLELFWKQYAVLKREYNGTTIVRNTPSRNGLPGRHIIIRMDWDLEPWERIAWQAALGSDPMRELLSSIRLTCGDIKPTLLIERPGYDESTEEEDVNAHVDDLMDTF